MQSQKLCLKWNNHTTNLLTVLGSFRQKEQLVDVTISCEGHSIKAHKIILSACSPYFEDIFQQNPCQHPIIIMNGMKYVDITAILNFMYKGEVNVSQDGLTSFLQAAEALKVKGLAEVCGEKSNTNSINKEIKQSDLNRPQRTDTPPRKRHRNRKRSLSDSNRSDDEGTSRKQHREPSSPEIHELSGDESFTGDNSSNGPPFNSTPRVPQNVYSRSHQSSSNVGGEEDDFEVEPSKMLEQTLTTEPASNSNTENNLRIERIMGNATEIESSSLQEPESPPDIKPIIDFGESSAGPSESAMMLYNEQSQPGPSNMQDGSLIHDNSHAQGKKVFVICDNVKTASSRVSDLGKVLISNVPVVTNEEQANKDLTITSNWLQKYQIPYHRFPKPVLFAIEKGIRPTPSARREMVRIIVDHVFQFTNRPIKKELDHIADMIVKRHPKSFMDTFNDVCVGKGYEGLSRQLCSRSENMRREQYKYTKKKLSLPGDAKFKSSDYYGCINFLPNAPDGEDDVSLSEKKEALKKLFTGTEWNEDRIGELMQKTFYLQRIDIANKMSFGELLMEWPFLSISRFLLKHFEYLMNFQIVSQLNEAFKKKIPELNAYLRTALLPSKCGGTTYHFLENLCKYFGESSVIKVYEGNAAMQVIETDADAPETPYIASLGDPYNQQESCLLMIQHKTASEFLNIRKAIAVWFCSFYVYNLEYPKTCPLTAEFFQRALLGINPKKGSKSNKRRCDTHSKVLTLVDKFTSFMSSRITD